MFVNNHFKGQNYEAIRCCIHVGFQYPENIKNVRKDSNVRSIISRPKKIYEM